MDNFKVVSHA
jgi:hypothetical protein